MNLSIILYDQLSLDISSLKHIDKERDYVLMCECNHDFTDIKHHKKKIALILSSMRHFKEELMKNNYKIIYKKVDDRDNKHSLIEEVKLILKKNKLEKINITKPSNFYFSKKVESWSGIFNIPVNIISDDRFIVTEEEFYNWSENKKELRMEFFYRELRKRFNILMDGKKPTGGKWNFDHDNRKTHRKSSNSV